MRHPVFMGLRIDKKPTEVMAPGKTVTTAPKKAAKKSAKKKKSVKETKKTTVKPPKKKGTDIEL
jgi:hypothetical protein